MKDELKDCPFCGGRPETDLMRGYSQYPSGKHGKAVSIACPQCNVEMMLCTEDHRGTPPEELMECLRTDWNKRANPRTDLQGCTLPPLP